ncbi:MAG: toluene tolerance protein [Deltaproteobacteria bacterium]|nr:toluene tolerance protein [Deltaproteobacteria bacterium]
MESISAETYDQLICSATILEKDGHGEKVLLTEDGSIVKIFRLKRLLSGAIFYPYVRRFSDNAKRLQQRDVLTIDIMKLGRCRQPKRDLVWYRPIAGQTFRDYCQQNGMDSMVESFARFIALLHHKGILFRSIHWGNIIVTDELDLGLIDIADIRFYRRSLTLKQRQRNFRHMLRYAVDLCFFNENSTLFWSVYQKSSHMMAEQCQQLQNSLAE